VNVFDLAWGILTSTSNTVRAVLAIGLLVLLVAGVLRFLNANLRCGPFSITRQAAAPPPLAPDPGDAELPPKRRTIRRRSLGSTRSNPGRPSSPRPTTTEPQGPKPRGV